MKITLVPSFSNGKNFGIDTLYFEVELSRQTMKDLPKEYLPVELIKYKHSKPHGNTK